MNKHSKNTRNSNITHGRGYVYSLQYHFVFVTKYRKPVFTDAVAQNVRSYLLDTMAELQMKCLAMEVMPDHIHILADCKPQLRPSDAVKVLKGNTSRWLFLAHPDIKAQLWDGHLWNPSYFVATVSDQSEEQIRNYINTQKTREPRA